MRPEHPDWVAPLFEELGKPRQPGSEQVAKVEGVLAAHLQRAGFAVERQSFRTSPRRLYAGSLLGSGIGWVAIGALPLMILPVAGWIVGTICIAALAVVVILSVGIADGIFPFDTGEVEAMNIVATAGSAPRVWLVAHSDTKGQWLSLRGRVFATLFTVIGVVVFLAELVTRLFGPLPWWIAVPSLLFLLLGSAALSRPPLYGESPGAVDNGSGVLAALYAAELLKDRLNVGVLITGAEEYGMEGAREWVRRGAVGTSFVNFDGVDATGQFNVMLHAAVTQVRTTPTATELFDEMRTSLRARGHVVRDRPLPLGIFVDGSILAKGGLGGITVSRGTWETLAVVHTDRDTIARTSPDGALEAGAATAEVLQRLLG